MTTILKYSECLGGNHVTIIADIDGVQLAETFDKDEAFSQPLSDRERILVVFRETVAKLDPAATTKEQIDWTAVKTDLESAVKP